MSRCERTEGESAGAAAPRGVRIRSTTVLAVKHQGAVVLAADGQVTLNATVVKNGARKVRRLGDGRALAGFAGSAADGITLLERFEAKLEASDYNLRRAAVELAKDWRTDKLLRRLEALMIVADRADIFLISGTGDVIQPDDGALGIGSGGAYALAAARALMQHSTLGARAIAEAALGIAAGICIYTNRELTVEELS